MSTLVEWAVIIGLGFFGYQWSVGEYSRAPEVEKLIVQNIDHPSTFNPDFLGYDKSKFDGQKMIITQEFKAVNKMGIELHYKATVIAYAHNSTVGEEADKSGRVPQKEKRNDSVVVIDYYQLSSITEA